MFSATQRGTFYYPFSDEFSFFGLQFVRCFSWFAVYWVLRMCAGRVSFRNSQGNRKENMFKRKDWAKIIGRNRSLKVNPLAFPFLLPLPKENQQDSPGTPEAPYEYQGSRPFRRRLSGGGRVSRGFCGRGVEKVGCLILFPNIISSCYEVIFVFIFPNDLVSPPEKLVHKTPLQNFFCRVFR